MCVRDREGGERERERRERERGERERGRKKEGEQLLISLTNVDNLIIM